MKKYIFTILIFFISTSLFSQSKEVIENDGTSNNISESSSKVSVGTKSVIAKKYFDKAFQYAKENDHAKAKEFYLKAIEEDKNFIEAYNNLGLTYRKIGKYDKAITYYKKSIALFSTGITAHQNLASVYSIQKNYEGAIQQYKEILKITPNNPEGFFGLANSYMMTSKFDEALINSKKATALYIESDSHYIYDGYYLSGLISYYSGNKDEAKKYFILTKKHGGKVDDKIEKELFQENKTGKEDDYRLETDEDYKKHEKTVIKIYDWLLTSPVNEKPSTRKELNTFLMKWMTGAPNVAIEISEKIVPYMDCGECLFIFMGGFTKYALQTNNYSKFEANLAGTKGVLQFYNANKKQLGVNKEIEKFIKLKGKNKLEKYLKKNI